MSTPLLTHPYEILEKKFKLRFFVRDENTNENVVIIHCPVYRFF